MIDIEQGRSPPFVNLGSYPRLHRLENEAVVLADFAAICVKRGRAPAPSSCPSCPPTSSTCPPTSATSSATVATCPISIKVWGGRPSQKWKGHSSTLSIIWMLRPASKSLNMIRCKTMCLTKDCTDLVPRAHTKMKMKMPKTLGSDVWSRVNSRNQMLEISKELDISLLWRDQAVFWVLCSISWLAANQVFSSQAHVMAQQTLDIVNHKENKS